MNGRAIPGAYLFRLYVCDKEMSWPHHTGETHRPDWVVYVRDSFYRNLREITFRLTNMIPERIIFISRDITVIAQTKSAAFICRNIVRYLFILCHIYITSDVQKTLQAEEHGGYQQHSKSDSVKAATTGPTETLTGILAGDQLFLLTFSHLFQVSVEVGSWNRSRYYLPDMLPAKSSWRSSHPIWL